MKLGSNHVSIAKMARTVSKNRGNAINYNERGSTGRFCASIHECTVAAMLTHPVSGDSR